MNSPKESTTEKQLLEHEKHAFQRVMDGSESISVQGYNENHEVIYWNKASETIYGYTRAEAIGKKLEDLSEEELEAAEEKLGITEQEITDSDEAALTT